MTICCASIYSDESRVILDFEQPEQVVSFETLKENANSITHNTDSRYVISGAGSALMFFPKATQGESRWPRMKYTLKEDERNWSDYDELHISFYNQMDCDQTIAINVYDVNGKSHPLTYGFTIKPGKNEYVGILAQYIGDQKIGAINFYTSDSPVDVSVYVDDVFLVASDEKSLLKVRELEKQVLREAPAIYWKRAGMQDKLEAILNDIAELRDAKYKAMERSRKVVDLKNKYLEEKNKMWFVLCQLSKIAFDNAYPDSAPWGYAWTSDTQKIYRNELPFFAEYTGTPSVSLARNEREGLQIILRSRRNLKHVNVTVLSDKNEKKLEINPLVVGFVKPPTANYPVEMAEWRPDPLLPFADGFDMEANAWQPIWLDVHATSDCKAGSIHRTVKISADGVPDLVIPVEINVWNFELPKEPTQPSLINYNTDLHHSVYIDREHRMEIGQQFVDYREGKRSFESLDPQAKMLRKREIETENLLLEHKVTPASLYSYRRRLQVDDVKRWRQAGGTSFSVTYLFPRPVKKGEPYEQWVYSTVMNNLNATVPALEKENLLDNAWCYAFDEIAEDRFYASKLMLEQVKKAYPQLPIITTAYDKSFGKDSGFDQYIDAWCPQIERFVEQLDEVRKVQATGKKVWYYSCLYDPGMDMLLEKNLTSPRLLCGLAQIKYRADGFLYYSTINGNMVQDPIDSVPLTKHTCGENNGYNGDGLLVYPTVRGPASSLRLKAMRDGFEDIEYLHLLQSIKREKLTEKEQAQLDELLAVPESIILNIEEYDMTGEALSSYREQIGNFLNAHRKLLNK